MLSLNKQDFPTLSSLTYTSDDPASYLSYNKVNGNPLPLDSSYGELPGGRDILPSSSTSASPPNVPIWDLVSSEEGKGMSVRAGIMSHGVPTVGYVCKEVDRPGKLNADLAMPIIRRNFEALKEGGVRDPMKLMEGLKRMGRDEEMTFPDGTVVRGRDVVEEERKGRKVVILGDTNDPSPILPIARKADILIHEATNSYLPPIDSGTTNAEVQRDTAKHGHSTPQMAGEFARVSGAKRLILNHFSPRYKGDEDPGSVRISRRIEKLAMERSGMGNEDVLAAWDFMDVSVPWREEHEGEGTRGQ